MITAQVLVYKCVRLWWCHWKAFDDVTVSAELSSKVVVQRVGTKGLGMGTRLTKKVGGWEWGCPGSGRGWERGYSRRGENEAAQEVVGGENEATQDGKGWEQATQEMVGGENEATQEGGRMRLPRKWWRVRTRLPKKGVGGGGSVYFTMSFYTCPALEEARASHEPPSCSDKNKFIAIMQSSDSRTSKFLCNLLLKHTSRLTILLILVTHYYSQ